MVVAAGDDISLPERTQRLVEAWLASGRVAKSIHSRASCIDDLSQDLGFEHTGTIALENPTVEQFVRQDMWLLGATHAWDMEVFRRFGHLIRGVVHEDTVIPLRSLLIGGVSFVPLPLVRYRVRAGVSFAAQRSIARSLAEQTPTWALRGRYLTAVQMYCDSRRLVARHDCLDILKKRRSRDLVSYWFSRGGANSPARYRLFRRGATRWFVFREFLRYRVPVLSVYVARLGRISRSLIPFLGCRSAMERRSNQAGSR